MYTINLISKQEIWMMTCRIGDTSGEKIFMTGITEEEENALDKGKSITIERDNHKFTISPDNIYVYGEIDFNKYSKDMIELNTFDWLDSHFPNGEFLPSNYDYKNHCAYSDRKQGRWYETWEPAKVAQYTHGIIDKPQRTLIFRKTFTKNKVRWR